MNLDDWILGNSLTGLGEVKSYDVIKLSINQNQLG